MDTPDEAVAPNDPLARAEAAYTAGDFAGVREQTRSLRAAADPEVAKQARALETRVAIDPWCWAVLGAALALFCAIVVTYAH
jgi:hypothetical protein